MQFKLDDLTGKTYGDLTVLSFAGSDKRRNAMWLCLCTCGNEKVCRGKNLKNEDCLSCGCRVKRRKELEKICKLCGGPSIKRNQGGSIGRVCHNCTAKRIYDFRDRKPKNAMLISARSRAKQQGFPCTITPDDFEIPEFCPVLGIKMEFGRFADRDNSPSLDKIVPELGYVKGNIAIISFRANRFKNDATVEELKKVITWMEQNQPHADSGLGIGAVPLVSTQETTVQVC